MSTAGDFHGMLIRLMHRAGYGESVAPDLEEFIVRLEQIKAFENLHDWHQSVASIRGSFMTHFIGPFATSAERMKDPTEVRKKSFAETAFDRLGTLMAQSTSPSNN